MNFKPITIADKEIFDDYLSKFQPTGSEMTFTNMFTWRNSKKHEWTEIDNHLIISFSKNNKRMFYPPVGKNPSVIIEKIFSEFPETEFHRVPKEIATQLEKKFTVTETRGQWDYVYKTKDMVELTGKKLRAKRNFINRFEKNDPESGICKDETNIAQKLAIQEKWCLIKDCDKNPELKSEDEAIREALTNYKELGLSSIIISIGDEPVAFAIGEKLNENTFVEHFEKSDSSYEGIFQYVFKEFARSIPERFEFLNREQDLDIPGLKKAKESYGPIKMIEKYKITNLD